MQSNYDDCTERWQDSGAGEDFQERIDQLHEFIDQAPNWS
jgi:hypothetical protein